MNKSILLYQNKSSINSINESFNDLTDFVIQSNQSRCACIFNAKSGNKNVIKRRCKQMNPGFSKIVNQYLFNGNGGNKSFFIEKNENNEQHFCQNVDSYVIVNKLYYNMQFSIVFGIEQNIAEKIVKYMSHLESMLDLVIKSKYYDDLNNNMQVDIKNLVVIIDEFGYLLNINSKLQKALELTNDIERINIVDLIENQYDNWMGNVSEVLNFKPFIIYDVKFKNDSDSISLRIKIFKGIWGAKPVFFITSSEINTFEIISMPLNRQTEASLPTEKVENADFKIRLKLNNKYNLYSINDIVYCKLSSNYIEIIMKDKSKTKIINSNLEISNKLMAKNFFQIHKSFIINLNHVIHYTKIKGCTVILTNNIKLEVSIRRITKFLSIMSERYL